MTVSVSLGDVYSAQSIKVRYLKTTILGQPKLKKISCLRVNRFLRRFVNFFNKLNQHSP